MWKKYVGYIKQILPLMKNSLLPALLLYMAVGGYLALTPVAEEWQHFFHVGFFAAVLASVAVLLFFNRNRPLFFLVVMVVCYCLINYLKYTHGIIYNLSGDYDNLVFLTVVCLLFFYFLPEQPLFSRDTVNFIVVIFAALALGEHLGRFGISVDFSRLLCNSCGLQTFGLILFATMLTVMLIHASAHDDILNVSLLFASVDIMLGFYLSGKSAALVLFFLTAALTVFTGIIRSLAYASRKDTVTGLDNGNTFIADSDSLPVKYGLGIICIDDYKHLRQIFKKKGVHEIVRMVAGKIRELEPSARIYRCGADEFIIIIPEAEKGVSFARVDHIRRSIAVAEFHLSRRKKPLKLTVSCSVTDKKRSDVNVFAVFLRARKILQKTYKFTQNITSQA